MALEVTPVKILGSTIALGSKHSLDVTETRQESLRVWKEARTQTAPSVTAAQPEPVQGDRLTISKEALQAYQSGAAQSAETSPISVDSEFFGLSPEDRLLILILEKVLGIKVKTPSQLERAAKGTDEGLAAEMQRIAQSASKQAEALKQAVTPPSRQGWGYILERSQSYEETETLSFAAKGLVNTADGRQISIDIQVNMKREFLAKSSLTVRGGDAKIVDPLVINYDGPAADLKQTSFVFDLDTDGNDEAMAALSGRSGFLAVDKNGDGAINNGTELFGPSTGDGFTELKALDSDGNSWIDGTDPAFEHLRIWSRDGSGNDFLVALAQKGVGAVYVGSVSAPFSVKDDSNALQAQNTKIGIYLKDSGLAGTIQQLDLAARTPDTQSGK